jgi:hypothetical protein
VASVKVEDGNGFLVGSEADYARLIREASKVDDVSAMVAMVNGINKAWAITQREAAKASNDARVAEAEKYVKAVTAFKANAEDVLGKAWATLVSGFEALPTSVAKSLTVRVLRNEDGSLLPLTLLVGEPMKIRKPSNGNGNGGSGKAESLTVNGKDYPSASAAKRELLADKADASMNRAAIVAALGSAGHTVT